MAINGVDYRVEPNAAEAYAVMKAYRLSKADGTAYDVAWTDHGLTCDCPDFIFRRDGLDPGWLQAHQGDGGVRIAGPKGVAG